MAFSSDRDGGFFNLYRKDSSGAGDEERLTNAKHHMDPLDWSSDGRWLAYHSWLNGSTSEVFVQAFSGDGKVGLTGSRVQVSNNGGGGPLWRRDGREVFYNAPPDPKSSLIKILAVPIRFDPLPRPERPRELFQLDYRWDAMHSKDVTVGRREGPDGPPAAAEAAAAQPHDGDRLASNR